MLTTISKERLKGRLEGKKIGDYRIERLKKGLEKQIEHLEKKSLRSRIAEKKLKVAKEEMELFSRSGAKGLLVSRLGGRSKGEREKYFRSVGWSGEQIKDFEKKFIESEASPSGSDEAAKAEELKRQHIRYARFQRDKEEGAELRKRTVDELKQKRENPLKSVYATEEGTKVTASRLGLHDPGQEHTVGIGIDPKSLHKEGASTPPSHTQTDNYPGYSGKITASGRLRSDQPVQDILSKPKKPGRSGGTPTVGIGSVPDNQFKKIG